MSRTLGNRAARAGSATLIGQAAKTGLLLVNLIVLGRLLDPEDFGIVALGLALVGVSDLLRDLGLSTAAIRSPELDHTTASNLFWVNTLLGFGLATGCAFVAPAIANLFGIDELSYVIWGLAAVFVLNGLQTQFQVQLARSYRFAALVITEVGSQLVGLVIGIALALEGAGFWALVGLQVSAATTTLLSRVLLARWRPSRYDRKQPIGPFVRFGASLTGGQLLGFISSSTPALALGGTTGPGGVGYFSRASQIVSIPINQGLGPLTNVVVASFSRVEQDSFVKWSRTVATIVSTAGVAIFLLLLMTAPSLIPVLLGPDWDSTADVVQILSVGAIFQALTFPYYWFFISLDLAGAMLRYNLVTKGLVVLATLLGTVWGLEGVAVGYATGLMLSLPICLFWFRNESRVPIRELRGLALRLTLVAGSAVGAFCAANNLPALGGTTSVMAGIGLWLSLFGLAWCAFCLAQDGPILRTAVRQAARRRS